MTSCKKLIDIEINFFIPKSRLYLFIVKKIKKQLYIVITFTSLNTIVDCSAVQINANNYITTTKYTRLKIKINVNHSYKYFIQLL